uniref:Uncharacterized protein n=1 Tax=uncultured bacterium contig00005 TaxID=1181497 RepID=A0A806KI60_9BACT|nr:hypothetical protein [uncultured bacterium contig00005]
MATETFFKTITIGDEAADRLIAEMDAPKEAYTPKRTAAEIQRGEEIWWNEYLSKKSSGEA